MPDCGRRAPDRLLSSLAMWPHWAGEQFFHSTSFACHTERKRDADVWETVYRVACTGSFRGFPNKIDRECASARYTLALPAAASRARNVNQSHMCCTLCEKVGF